MQRFLKIQADTKEKSSSGMKTSALVMVVVTWTVLMDPVNCYSSVIRKREVTCDDPGYPNNGIWYATFDIHKLEVGSIMRFSCNDGFNLHGAPVIECTRSGTWNDSSPTCIRVKGCGVAPSIPKFDSQIIGGETALVGAWPWQAYITHESAWCGGALINEEWVLTAGHCVFSQYSQVPAHTVKVYLGKHVFNNQEDSVQWRRGKEIVVYPGYGRPIPLDADIALIRLMVPVTYTDRVRPVCLPDPDRPFPPPGSYGKVTGWGRTEDATKSMELKQATAKVVARDVCTRFFGRGQFTRNMFCTQGTTEDFGWSCKGDSGGPLVFYDNSHWVVEGLVSWVKSNCQDDHTVFVTVRRFLPWIKRYVDI